MDHRTAIEKFMWQKFGPPLYYCADCLRAVDVTPVAGAEPTIARKCDHTGQIIAPRRAVCVGQGGMSLPTRIKIAAMQTAAGLTGRCV